MSKRFLLILLVCWNILLTGAVIWSLTRARVPDRILNEKLTQVADGQSTPLAQQEGAEKEPFPEARIAYFMMDSVEKNFELVKESAERVRMEGQRMETRLQREMQKAQARYNELMSKDHTYSTQAELKADQEELERLGDEIQHLQIDLQNKLDRMQIELLSRIGDEIKEFLGSYNKEAGFDFIFSIQDAGQIWVGNEALDITKQLVDGLNAKHNNKQAQDKKPGKATGK